MLQSSTTVQFIVGIITLVIFYMGMYFWNLAEGKGNEKHRLLSIIFFIVTAIGLGYFFFNLITTTPYTFGNGFWAFIKASIVIIIGVEIFLYSIDGLEEGMAQFLSLSLASVVVFGIVSLGMLFNNEQVVKKYEQNVVEVEDTRLEKEQYELVAEFDEEEMHAVISENYVTITPYFRRYYKNNVEMYDFFYKENNEVKYKEIKADFLTLVPIKEGKKSYYVVNNYIKYSLDYNNDPPTECNVSKSWNYELHIPKEYIDLIQNQNKKK